MDAAIVNKKLLKDLFGKSFNIKNNVLKLNNGKLLYFKTVTSFSTGVKTLAVSNTQYKNDNSVDISESFIAFNDNSCKYMYNNHLDNVAKILKFMANNPHIIDEIICIRNLVMNSANTTQSYLPLKSSHKYNGILDHYLLDTVLSFDKTPYDVDFWEHKKVVELICEDDGKIKLSINFIKDLDIFYDFSDLNWKIKFGLDKNFIGFSKSDLSLDGKFFLIEKGELSYEKLLSVLEYDFFPSLIKTVESQISTFKDNILNMTDYELFHVRNAIKLIKCIPSKHDEIQLLQLSGLLKNL